VFIIIQIVLPLAYLKDDGNGSAGAGFRREGTLMQSMTLPQPWRNLLLSVHVAASVSVFGADLVLLMLGSASLGGADPVTIYPAARLVGAWLVAPFALLALGTGLLLGLLTPWGLFTHWWVIIKLAIVVILTGAVLFVLVPALSATANAVIAPTPQPLATGARLPLVMATAVASMMLAVALVLAIFKPGWRLRSGAARGIVPPHAQHE
jgi:hypothetical protein